MALPHSAPPRARTQRLRAFTDWARRSGTPWRARDEPYNAHPGHRWSLRAFWDLHGVVLVGHSYGGFVISGVADRLPHRVAHLVFLDALLPRDGESRMDLEGAEQLRAMTLEDGWLLALPDNPDATTPLSRGHPIGTLQEKLHLSRPLEEQPFSRTYVKAGKPPQPPPDQRQGNFWKAAARVRNDPNWRYAELPGGHALHREIPETVAGLLLDIVRQD